MGSFVSKRNVVVSPTRPPSEEENPACLSKSTVIVSPTRLPSEASEEENLACLSKSTVIVSSTRPPTEEENPACFDSPYNCELIKNGNGFPPLAPPRNRKATVFSESHSKDVDDHTRNAPDNFGSNFQKLVGYLLKIAKTDIMKARSFYVWICSKNYEEIASKYPADLTTPFGYLSAIHNKSAQHGDLFKKFCDIAEIPCLVVGGPVRNEKFEPNKDLTDHRNQWNLVYCAHGWRIVDCHWGGTKSAISIPNPAWILIDGTFDNGKRKQSESVTRIGSGTSDSLYQLDAFYFLTDPEEFIYSHFADQPEHQLLDQPKTLDQFKELALLASGFFELGLHLKSHSKILTNHDEAEVVLQFALPMNAFVSFSYKLFINEKRTSTNVIDKIPLDKFVFEQIQNKIVCFTLRVPAKSYYKLIVYGRLCSEEDSKAGNLSLSRACTYFFQCNSTPKNVSPLPNDAPTHFGPTPEMTFLGLTPVTHLAGVVDTDNLGNAEIRVKMAKPCDFLCEFFSIKYSKKELESFFVHRAVDKDRIFNLKCPEPGEYVLQIYSKLSQNTANSYSYIFSYLVQYKGNSKNLLKKDVLVPKWPLTKSSNALGPNFKVVNQQKVRALVSDYLLYADENGEFEIDFEFDSPIDFSFDCTSTKGKEKREGMFFLEKKVNSATMFASLPRPGFHLITVYTKPESLQTNNFPQSFYFLVYALSCRENPNVWPKSFSQWGTDCELLCPSRGQLEPNMKTCFSVKIPGAEDVAIVWGSKWHYLEKDDDSDRWCKVVNTGPGGHDLQLFVRKPEDGSKYYSHLVFNVEKPETWSRLMRVNGLVFDKERGGRLEIKELSDVYDQSEDPEFVELEKEKAKAKTDRDLKEQNRIEEFEQEIQKVKEAEKQMQELAKKIQELLEELSKTRDADKQLQLEIQLRKAETDCRNFEEENVRNKMKVAVILQDQTKIQESMEEFKAKNVPDTGGEFSSGAEALVLFSLRDNLSKALESNKIESIQDTMNAIHSHNYKDALQTELIEAKFRIKKLRRLMSLRHQIMELNQNALAEVKSYNDPSSVVKDVFYATFRLLGENKKSLKDWTSVCGLLGKLGKENVRRRIVNFSPDQITDNVVFEIRQLLDQYEMADVRAVSVAAGAFFVWARGVVDNP